MLLHVLKYKFICLIRDKAIIFWAFMFPVILAVLFHIVLININPQEEFMKVEFSVVDNDGYRQDIRFKNYVNSIIESYENNSQSIYNISIRSLEESEQLLEDNKIDGYVKIEDELKLIVKRSGTEQSLIKALLDEYIQINSTMETILSNNPSALENIDLLTNNFIEDVPLSESDNTDFSIMIYYSLIAMSCLYASFWGLRIITLSQADLSSIGARMGLIPQKKLHILAIDFFVSWIIQLGIITFQLIFMSTVLNVELLKPIGLVFLTTAVGSAMAISLGSFIGAVIKKDEDTQVTIINSVIGIGYVITVSQINEILESKLPFLACINPIKLVNDGLLSLYYFDNYAILARNVVLMSSLTFFFSAITYLTVRRVKYASI
ncbi:ABC transporter permease [Clostridium sp. D2Q-11]|uniref:ABC transporter permease n=1 Tax=Anaeromonas frigoriresistens TaxID=2683708 RepID=A0A942UZ51_9FIRM|nr:ABC transporter permease [Anaeromonas frigoriresistens]MBS4539479.1 ABC transporter permease [Anaeromonas frigoriresistens]